MASMTGLLVLTQPVRKIIPCLPKVLEAASKHVSKTLYIHLDPLASIRLPETKQQLALYSHIIKNIYSSSLAHCRDIDVRILLAGFKCLSEVPPQTCAKIDLLLFCGAAKENLVDLEKRYKDYLHSGESKVLLFEKELQNEEEIEIPLDAVNELANKIYSNVVIGGTFDCIHAGHKILLSEALLRCKDRLTCGVADGPLLKNKTLSELIVPCNQRIRDLKKLANDIDPTVEYNLVQITEPMGPTRWDSDLELIVVSEETKKGVKSINKAREENDLRPLDVYIIELADDPSRENDEEEVKISSSSLRMRLLGTILKPIVSNPAIAHHPHIIGLTGGSASGKSSIAKRLARLGAAIVDCDRLGHEAYKRNTECYMKLVETFGADIIGSDDEINRKTLGAKVFTDKKALKTLNSLVWPEIGKLIKKRIAELKDEGFKIIILDAAVLLDAGWEEYCHQVWVSIIKREEAIRRIVERDEISQERAEQRIDNQLSNKDLVAKANVVFCTQWSGEYTQHQVEKAWTLLNNNIREQMNNGEAKL